MGRVTQAESQAGDGSVRQHITAGSRYLAKTVLLALAYFAAAQLSFGVALPPGYISPFWPPAAIALCGCILWGYSMAPGIWLGALLSNMFVGMPPMPAVAIAAGNVLEAWTALLLLRHVFTGRLEAACHDGAFTCVLIVTAASALSASIGVAALAAWGQVEPHSFARSWLTWWLGDTTGILVLAPLFLSWKFADRQRWTPARIIEALVFALLLVGVTHVAFSGTLDGLPLSYLPLAFVLWAAFRFGLPVVACTTAVICMIAVWHTSHGRGNFTVGDMNTSLLLLMTYISIVGTTGIVVAGLLRQRNLTEAKLRSERDILELRVRQKTAALVADIEQRKRIERQLAEAQELAQIGSWNMELDSGILSWSDELYRIYGVDKRSFRVTSENTRRLVHPDDLPQLTAAIEHCRRTGEPSVLEYRIVLPSGEIRIVAGRGQISRSEGRPQRMFGTVQDITETKRIEISLREAEERYRTVVESSPDAILVNQNGVIVFANRAAHKMLGVEQPEQLAGRSSLDFLHPDFHAVARERLMQLHAGEPVPQIEERFRRLDGSIVEVEVNSSAFWHQGRPAVLLILRDISERKKVLEQMAYLAHFDSLTGLPNRTLFHQRLEHALSIAERPGRSLEILFLDLDRFKNINDTLGHAAGDMVLQEAAHRLQASLRESDTVARLGGDEFVVLIENIDEPHRGGIIAEKILAAFEPPFLPGSQPLAISTSIGIASYPVDGINADTLLKNADIAMYRAKELGRNNYRYYSPETNLHSAERLSLEYALGSAIEHGELSMYYQPKIDVLSNRITGMEALLRWWHPTLGLILPHRFIPLAEETGMIRSIGHWALHAACAQNKFWQDTSGARLKVAVNLSLRQLTDERLIDNIGAILDETGLEARYLELEITESAAMSNPDKAILIFNTLRDMGISVAIDDFGIGYSSLAYLKQLPIRAVKIDRSFVHGIPGNRGDSAITKAIISLAHSLECSVIAEGAETRQQVDFLRDHECDSVQGFYFSEPMSAELFGDLLKAPSNLHLH